MRRTLSLATAGAAVVAMALAFAAPSFAETIQFKAALNGATEVPPNQTAGTGTLTATFDPATKVLTWKGDFSGLTGDVQAAHFHGPAEPGKNAGVLVWISTKGTPLKGPFEGTATLTDDQVTDLMAGLLYVNFHTTANPGGELRGQLTKM
jgi:CHRD domain